MRSKFVAFYFVDYCFYWDNFRLILRLVTDDSNAVCRFSMKFGADMITACHLFDKARENDLEIIGVRY
jgi:ornithine decarboxylase